jgi:hypothetical protein
MLADGDSIVMINRYTTLGGRDPELSLWNLDARDFNRVRVKRGAEIKELSFRMGEWVLLPGDRLTVDPAAGGQTRRMCRAAK